MTYLVLVVPFRLSLAKPAHVRGRRSKEVPTDCSCGGLLPPARDCAPRSKGMSLARLLASCLDRGMPEGNGI